MSSDLSRSLADFLVAALQAHQSGQLDQAESMYRRVLAHDPRQADALHLLGVLLHQRGQNHQAADLIRRALEVFPDQPHFHGNLSAVLRALDDLDGARRHAEAALRQLPDAAPFHNALAVTLQSQGLHEQAIDHLRTALELESGSGGPPLALYHNNLALSLRELKRFDEAIESFREALRLDPKLAMAHSNLGQLLLERHKPAEALPHCEEALRLQPNYAEACNNLGNVLRQLHRLEDAKRCYQQALRLTGADQGARQCRAMAHNNLGQALQEEGRLDEAVACYHQALASEPDSPRFLTNLASALAGLDRNEEAMALCRRALQVDPGYAPAHSCRADLLMHEGDLDGSIAGYREALRLLPDSADTHLSLGLALASEGELAPALSCYRTALEYQPDHPGALSSLAKALRGDLPEEDLDTAQRLLGESLSAPQEAVLRFGLAAVLDARGRYREAGEHLAIANRLRRRLLESRGKGYDPAAHQRFIDQSIATFDESYFARASGWGVDSETPVFIIGMPRSGTTLTDQVLASHPQVFGAGELRLARRLFEGMPARLGSADPPPLCGRHYTAEVLRAAAEEYLEPARALAGHRPVIRIVDKMPENYLYLGWLATLFPKARFIHTRRDVRDTALSCWMTDFNELLWAFDQEHIASRIRDYLRLMAHWRRVLPVDVLEVDYEQTVADLEGTARRLLAWCGLEWDPACLDFHKTRRPIRTASVHQVRQPVYTRSVGRWKHYAETLTPLLDRLQEAIPEQPLP